MKTVSAHITVCPRCGRTYHGLPALSRVDNETRICPARRFYSYFWGRMDVYSKRSVNKTTGKTQ